MKSNELRIGNLYMATDGTGVNNVIIDDLLAWSEGAVYGKPIPLTEEWLIKLGDQSYFTSDPQERQASKAFEFGNVKIHMCNEDIQEFLFESMEFVQIKTVHQLQNLCFSINNKELTIKT